MEIFEHAIHWLYDFVPVLRHEYALTLYGVIAWAIVWGKPNKRLKAITLGMSGGGAIIAWDDELLSLHNQYMTVDFTHWPFYIYVIAGFISVWVITKYWFKDLTKDVAD